MNIAVIPNSTKDSSLSHTIFLCDVLKEYGAKVLMESEYSSLIRGICCVHDIYEEADAAIVLGGDGTILRTAVPCALKGIPVMGINLGRVGFMTETELDDIKYNTKRLLDGDFIIENRMMMNVSIVNKDKQNDFLALNDCVVSKPDAQMVKVAVFANGEEITEYIADGVIISTPTGSTGYSLSAGGPVADPSCEIFLATPICAHTLLARPAVLSSEKEITVELFSGANSIGDVTVDGIVTGKLSIGDSVIINKADTYLKLIKFKKQSFYDIMTAKLV